MGLFRTALSLLAHCLVQLLPRNDSLWVFGSRGGEHFKGNTKYLFLHLKNKEDIRPVWISESEATVAELRAHGFEAYRTDSLRGQLTLLRAGFVFVTGTMTDMPLWPTGGACLIQLWHGVPLKRIAIDAPNFAEFSTLERLRLRYTYRQFDAITLTAAELSDFFRSAFRIDPALPVTGYPRNDALAREISGERIGQGGVHELLTGITTERLIAYLPTYREDGSDPTEHIDFETLNAFLAEHDAVMLVKFHPFNDPKIDTGRFDHIHFLPVGFDVYPTLRNIDVLITDYSSVYFDFLHLDRPVVFYAYDREAYMKSPGFHLDYDEVTPGPIAETFDELLDALTTVFSSPESHADDRERVRQLAFDYVDDGSAERVFRYARSRE